MRSIGVLAGVVVIGVVMAGAASQFLPALNDPTPPLSTIRPFVAPPGPRLARKVVLVIVDGLRVDATRDLPGLGALRARGIDATARSPFPTLSKAGYVTLLTGVGPRFSGARTNDSYRRVPLDSLLARVRRSGYVADRSLGIPRLFGVSDAVVAPVEAGVADVIAPSLARNDLIVALWMAVDAAGHRHGGASEAYRDAARAVDAQLSRVLAAVDLSIDAVVVTADHGHTDRGGHGGGAAEVEVVPLVLAGAGVRERATIEGATLADIAPTIAALLGVPAPGHGTGRTLVEALAVTAEQRAALVAADAHRAAYLAPVLQEIEDAEDARSRGARRWRVPLAVVAIGALVGLVAMLARRRWLVIDRRSIGAAATFAPVYLGLVFGLDRVRAPLGVPGDRGSLWLEHLLYGGIAVGALVAASRLACRGRNARDARLRGIALAGLAIALAPALAAWALIGEHVATTLPGPALVVVSPVAYTGVTFYAAGCILVFAIEGLGPLLCSRR